MRISGEDFNNAFGDIDLELLDLILKGHFQRRNKILDIGCGEGRNLIYFAQGDFDIYGIDTNKSSVILVKYLLQRFGKNPEQILHGNIEEQIFTDDSMDAVICARVLHFAESENNFLMAWRKIRNILKPGGLLYCSLDSMIGFEEQVSVLGANKWRFKDGSVRFLLNEGLLTQMNIQEDYEFLSPMKTIHYSDQHAQTIFCLTKRA